MSRAAELARAEADAVEAAEQSEPGEPDTGEPAEPGEPEPEPKVKRKQMSEQAQLREFERIMQAHDEALAALFGDEWANMSPCSFCNGLGHSVTPEYQHHGERERCSSCGGHGQLITGSLRPGHEVVDCEACQGTGSRVKMPPPPAMAQGQPHVVYVDPATGYHVPPPPGQPAMPPPGQWAPGYEPAPTSPAAQP